MTVTAMENLYRLQGQHAMVTIGDQSFDCEVVDAPHVRLRRDGHDFFPDPQILTDVQPVLV